MVGDLPASGHRRHGDQPGRRDRRVRGRSALGQPPSPATMSTPTRRLPLVALAICASLVACSKANDPPRKDPPAASAAPVVASAAPSASVASVPQKDVIPTL